MKRMLGVEKGCMDGSLCGRERGDWRQKEGVRGQEKRGQGAGWKDHGPGPGGLENVTKV